jgi:hypothetical protein
MDPNALFSDEIRGQLDRLFLQREDGDWDYYPRGFAKPGYRVDAAVRQKLLAEPVFPRHGFLVVVPTLVGTWFSHSFENKLLFAIAAGLLPAILHQVYRRGRLRITLSESRERVPALSKVEQRRRKVENWQRSAPWQKCLVAAFYLCIVVVPAWYSWAHFFDPMGAAWLASKVGLLVAMLGLWFMCSLVKLTVSSP